MIIFSIWGIIEFSSHNIVSSEVTPNTYFISLPCWSWYPNCNVPVDHQCIVDIDEECQLLISCHIFNLRLDVTLHELNLQFILLNGLGQVRTIEVLLPTIISTSSAEPQPVVVVDKYIMWLIFRILQILLSQFSVVCCHRRTLFGKSSRTCEFLELIHVISGLLG